MQLEQRMAANVAVLKVRGEITLVQGGDATLKETVRRLLEQGHARILVDLGDVSYVDSAGLGQLVQVYATTRNAGGALKLLKPNRRLHELLAVTRLMTVFEAFDSEADALASFGAPSA